MALSDTWQRLSPREQRMVALAGAVVAVALAWVAVWKPINADIARLARDVPRIEELAAQARAQADDIAALARAAPAARAQDPLPAVERVLAERGLRAAVGSLDMQDGRVRMTFAMVRFDALPPLLDALARTAGLLAVDVVLQPRVEAGFVRAEIVLGTSK
jgi:type II secretory pathway component PulM